MQIDLPTLATIVGMAIVTYATRAGGVWLLGRFQLSPHFDAWLRHVPGAVLVAIVAPLLASGGTPDIAAGLATAAVAARTNNLLLAIIVGVGMVWTLRLFL